MFHFCRHIKEAIIFIDEFDATKDTILKNIIQNGLRDKVDFIELFKDIHAALHMDTFPTDLTTPSMARRSGDYKNQSLEGVVNGIREKADYIFDTYSLKYKHRTLEEVNDLYQNYLFQDHQFHSVLNASNAYIRMKTDSSRRINVIDFSKAKPTNDSASIHTMLGQLRGFIKFFQGAVNILAINSSTFICTSVQSTGLKV